ncbi:TPA: glycosyltransferase [Vibrio vulnificus]|nr:glycosyltransferase [Vibrio vulnificus]HAS8497341.1 glycosyltransferase [Vibrio vulnificus]
MNDKNITILGLPFMALKYKYLIDTYISLGMHVTVLLNDDQVDKDWLNDYNIKICGRSKIKRAFCFFKHMTNDKPNYVDVYDYSILTLFYLLICRLFNVKSRLWLIGGELKYDFSHLNEKSKLKKGITIAKVWLTKLSLFVSDNILIKEKHHAESINKISPSLLKKATLLHNCVPVNGYPLKGGYSNKSDFIYANAVIESRNVHNLVTSLKKLEVSGYEFTCSIYGFNCISNDVYAQRGVGYSEYVFNLAKSINLTKNVSMHGFVKDIKEKYLNFRFFILPGDVIFANYALLEAMSVGLVPIVYPGNGYEDIVVDGHNGLVVQNFDLVQTLIRAIEMDDDEYSRLSLNSFKKIKEKYSLEKWKEELALSFIS